jgi:hypothetical protein
MVVVRSHPMSLARPVEQTRLLLFCPEQGGWRQGVYREGRWLDFLTLTEELEPTGWLPLSPDPEER